MMGWGTVAAMMLAQFALPKVVDYVRGVPGQPGQQSVGGANHQRSPFMPQPGPRIAGVEPHLDEPSYQGLVRALQSATPAELDQYELELLRSQFPGAASLLRARSQELRQTSQATHATQEQIKKQVEEQVQAQLTALLASLKAAGVKVPENVAAQAGKASSEVKAPAPAPKATNGKAQTQEEIDAAAILAASAALGGNGAPPAKAP